VNVDEQVHADIASALLEAYRTRMPIEPPTEKYEGLGLADAYAIQARQIAHWVDNGAVIKGHKVGLTSGVMQRQMKVNRPDYGVLRDDMFYSEDMPVPIEEFIAPRVEPEIAFVLKKDLSGPGVSIAEAIAAVDFCLPALEIIDSRISDWRIGIIDTIADNASSGGVVLGSTPSAVDAADLRLVGCNLFGNGALVATGAGGAALGSPLLSLAWLANTLGEHGVSLRAGHVVLPGSVTAAKPVAPGDTWTAQFAGIGSVTVRFAGRTVETPVTQ
jgi:2-keto-4-pentenoate hydratase